MTNYVAQDNEPADPDIELCVVKTPGLFGYQHIYNKSMMETTDFIRISEFVKVSFVPREPKEYIPEMVDKIDQMIQKAHVEQAEKLKILYDRKQNLLSLVYNIHPVFSTAAEGSTESLPDDDIPF